MKIYIINLKKSTKKKALITEMFQNFEKWSKITLNYEFFTAIDGNECDYSKIKTFPYWFDPWSHLHLTKGEVGCALSHIALWEKLIIECKKGENKDNCCMIFEDDFVINNKEVFKKLLNITNPDFDLLYLGRKKISDEVEMTSTKLDELSHRVVEAKFSYWCIGYLLSLSGAKNLYYKGNNEIWFKNNIFPVDEYIPWVYGQTRIFALKDQPDENSRYLALEPSIIEPVAGTFQNSSTYFSRPVQKYRNDIVLITVATDSNDAVIRYVRTCNKYGFQPIILGLNKGWRGGDMSMGVGGGQKINLLRKYLMNLKQNKLVIFTDSYDVIANNHINLLIKNYKKYYNDKIVFGSECTCWPNENLEKYYPQVKNKNKFLNSGNFIGWRDDLLKIMDLQIQDNEDDQLYFTINFFDSLRSDNKICLDYENHLFLCLNDAYNYTMDHSKSCLIMENGNRPSFIHGNGPASVKRRLNRISNYAVGGWNSTYGYKGIYKHNMKVIPKVLIAYDKSLGYNQKTADSIIKINYPKDKIRVVEFTEESLKDVLDDFKLGDYEFLFYINSNVELVNADYLNILIKENKSVISPLLIKNGEIFSNFWGDIAENNFYKRSDDYLDIVNKEKKGCWNVAYVSACFLMKKDNFKKEYFTENIEMGDGWDMALCYNLRKNNIFMWVVNYEEFGVLKDFKGEETELNIEELDRYVKTILRKDFLESPKIVEIGENILKIPIFREEFCIDLINKCNNFGDWSKGGDSYFDKRISNVENYPTQDIHLHQLGFGEVWGYIVDKYISKLVWDYYKYSTKDINLAFVVKYDMEKQRDLKPHHDASTYTVNVCLNNTFEGGGCKFIRQNQSIINKDIGSMIIHPGKLTHYHEGLPIINGERFILVSFIN